MSASSSNVTAPTVPADTGKELGSHYVVIPVANTVQTVNPAVNMQSVTVANLSSTQTVRATFTFAAGITSAGAAATRTQLLPPLGVISVDLGRAPDPTGEIEAIDSIAFVVVNVPTTTTEASALIATVGPLPLAVRLTANFASA